VMKTRFGRLWWIGFLILVMARLALASGSAAQDQSQPAQPGSAPQQQGADTPAPTPPTATPAATPATQSPTANAPATNPADQSKEQTAKSKDRLFYAMPNFSTVESSQKLPPLSVGAKFKLVTRSTFDPFQFFWYGLVSGVSQATNSEPGYGQGWGAYGVRYASAFGDGLIESYMVGAVFPSVLRQDPRYYQLGKGSFMHRTGYALSRLVITRTDAGNPTFNASEIVGSAVAAGISTYSYHPHEDKTLSNTASVWGTQVAYDAIAIELKEFWPDLRRKFQKKHAKAQD
jgi:hypothetical protein